MSVDILSLLKLRLILCRYGELDNQGWWGTERLLSDLGRTVLERAFPRTQSIARTRLALSIASKRAIEIFNPSGCVTLWSMPPEIELAVDDYLLQLTHNDEPIASFIKGIEVLDKSGLSEELQARDLVDSGIISSVKQLRTSDTGKSVQIPGVHIVDDQLIQLLAAAHEFGSIKNLVIPYARLQEDNQ